MIGSLCRRVTVKHWWGRMRAMSTRTANSQTDTGVMQQQVAPPHSLKLRELIDMACRGGSPFSTGKQQVLDGNGINVFANSSPGFYGSIKTEPEDFIVKEIRPDGTVCEMHELEDKTVPELPYECTQAAENERNVQNEQNKHCWNGTYEDCVEVLTRTIGFSGFKKMHKIAMDIAVSKGIVVPQSFQDHIFEAVEKHNFPTNEVAQFCDQAENGQTDKKSQTLAIQMSKTLETTKGPRGELRRAISLYPFLNTSVVNYDDCDARTTICSTVVDESDELSGKCILLGYDSQLEPLKVFMPAFDYFWLLFYIARGPRHPHAVDGVIIRLSEDRQERKKFFGILHTKYKFLDGKHSSDVVNKCHPLHPDGELLSTHRHEVFISYKKAKRLKRLREETNEAVAITGDSASRDRIGRETWLHFLLRKHKQEHVAVTRALTDVLSVHTHRLITAGIKDKEAITLQRASIQGIHPSTLLNVLDGAKNRTSSFYLGGQLQCLVSLDVGKFRYAATPLQVGELGGNHFSIKIRGKDGKSEEENSSFHKTGNSDFDYVEGKSLIDECEIEFIGGAAETALRANIYGNWVIAGTINSDAHVPRRLLNINEKLMLEMIQNIKCKGFINYYGSQRVGSGFFENGFSAPDIGASLYRNDFVQAIHRLMLPRVGAYGDERKARVAWSQNRDPHQASKLFPLRCTSQHIVLNELKKDADDFISNEDAEKANMVAYAAFDKVTYNMKTIWLHAYQSLVWNRMVSLRLQIFDHKIIPGDLVLLDTSTENTPVTVWSRLRTKPEYLQAHTVTDADVDARRFGLEHLVLPVPGRNVMYPLNGIGEAYLYHIRADGTQHYMWPKSVAAASESRTSSIKNASVKCDDTSPEWFRATELESRCEIEVNEGLKKTISGDWLLSTRGSYRHVFVVPQRVEGTTNSISSDSSNVSVDFSLPPGSYATVCMRELMKGVTS